MRRSYIVSSLLAATAAGLIVSAAVLWPPERLVNVPNSHLGHWGYGCHGSVIEDAGIAYMSDRVCTTSGWKREVSCWRVQYAVDGRNIIVLDPLGAVLERLELDGRHLLVVERNDEIRAPEDQEPLSCLTYGGTAEDLELQCCEEPETCVDR